MKFLSIQCLLLVAFLAISGCRTYLSKPYVFYASLWANVHADLILSMSDHGTYGFAIWKDPSATIDKNYPAAKYMKYDGEEGTWKIQKNQLILKSKSDEIRTFTIHEYPAGQWLEDSVHFFPRFEMDYS